MAEPGLQVSRWNRLNLKKLKMGFKQIYGDTVYGFFIWLKWILLEITRQRFL
jgi:hypothetical protein